MKTLQEVEPRTPISSLPFTISQPGSYYLTGDLTGASGQNAILITSSNVTLDLMGFTLQGGGGIVSGITFGAGPDKVNIVIRNGRIRGWGAYGIYLFDASLRNIAFEDLMIESNLVGGVSCPEWCRVLDSTLIENGGDSITVGSASLVQGNVVISLGSGTTGIAVTGFPSRIDGNHVRHFGTGIHVTTAANLIVRNSVYAATPYNIVAGNHVGPITNNPAVAGPWANFDLTSAP
jgi:hypothetical protein